MFHAARGGQRQFMGLATRRTAPRSGADSILPVPVGTVIFEARPWAHASIRANNCRRVRHGRQVRAAAGGTETGNARQPNPHRPALVLLGER